MTNKGNVKSFIENKEHGRERESVCVVQKGREEEINLAWSLMIFLSLVYDENCLCNEIMFSMFCLHIMHNNIDKHILGRWIARSRVHLSIDFYC